MHSPVAVVINMVLEHKTEQVHGYRLVFGYLGILMMLIGAITLLPLLSLCFYPEEINEAGYFILPGVGAITIGYLMYFHIRDKEKDRLRHNQDALIVVTCWSLAIVITALPFVLSGNYTLIQALFETTSGWSTTGLSIVDVEQTSHLFLIHRTTILFFGGVGLVLVMLSVLSDSYGMRLYSAEGHSDRLLPNLVKSARMILTIYFAYIMAGIFLYMMCGMSFFDAFIHSVGALSTGGFSSHAQSIAYYQSPAIEYITILLMLLGNINFLAHLFLIKGKWKRFFAYCEVRCTIAILSFTFPILLFFCLQHMELSLSQGLRTALFQGVSALTTTGYQTIPSFAGLPHAMLLLLILLQLIGGGSGSTAGGIKQIRIYILWKGLCWHFKERLQYRNVIQTYRVTKVDQEIILTKEEISATGVYVFFYLLLFCLGTLLLTCYGYSLEASMFEFSSALSTVGLSAGIMVASAPAGVLITGIIGMFFGRLEIFVILVAVAQVFQDGKKTWKKSRNCTILKRKRRSL